MLTEQKLRNALVTVHKTLTKAHCDSLPIPTEELVRTLTVVESALDEAKTNGGETGKERERVKATKKRDFLHKAGTSLACGLLVTSCCLFAMSNVNPLVCFVMAVAACGIGYIFAEDE